MKLRYLDIFGGPQDGEVLEVDQDKLGIDITNVEQVQIGENIYEVMGFSVGGVAHLEFRSVAPKEKAGS